MQKAIAYMRNLQDNIIRVNTNKKDPPSRRRRWLAAILSHHRAYRSVYGGFNSWRAETETPWINHNTPSVSVFLLLTLGVPHHFLPSSSNLYDCMLLHRPPIPANLVLTASASLSSAVSTVSWYTFVSFDTAIHSLPLCSSSYPQFRSNSAILAWILWFVLLLFECFRICSGKWASSICPWLSSMHLHGHGYRSLSRSSHNKSQDT